MLRDLPPKEGRKIPTYRGPPDSNQRENQESRDFRNSSLFRKARFRLKFHTNMRIPPDTRGNAIARQKYRNEVLEVVRPLTMLKRIEILTLLLIILWYLGRKPYFQPTPLDESSNRPLIRPCHGYLTNVDWESYRRMFG